MDREDQFPSDQFSFRKGKSITDTIVSLVDMVVEG